MLQIHVYMPYKGNDIMTDEFSDQLHNMDNIISNIISEYQIYISMAYIEGYNVYYTKEQLEDYMQTQSMDSFRSTF